MMVYEYDKVELFSRITEAVSGYFMGNVPKDATPAEIRARADAMAEVMRCLVGSMHEGDDPLPEQIYWGIKQKTNEALRPKEVKP